MVLFVAKMLYTRCEPKNELYLRTCSSSSPGPVSQCQSCRPLPCGFEHLQGAGRDSLFFLRASTIDPQLQCPKAYPCPSQSCPAQLVNDDISSSMPEPIVRLRQSHSAEPTVYHLQQLLLLQLYYISDLSHLCNPYCKVQLGDWFTMCN